MTRPVSGPFTSRVTRSSSSVATTSCSTCILSSSVLKTSAAFSLVDISGPRRLPRHLGRLRLVTVHPPLLEHGKQSVGQDIDGQPRRQEQADGGEHHRHHVAHHLLLRVGRRRRQLLLR